MGETNRKGIRAAICSALAAGALTCGAAMAHETTDATVTTSGLATVGGVAPTTAGYGAATASDSQTSGATDTTTDGASVDGDQARSETDRSTAVDQTGPNRADLYSSRQTSEAARTAEPQQTEAMPADADQASRAQSSRSGAGATTDVVWYVMPVTLQAQSDQISNGCWVQLYAEDNFQGRYVSVVGPAYIHEMGSPDGVGMSDWESAVVGPNATVTTYDAENFQSRNATLRDGQRYPDLDDSKLGLFDEIESMKVQCTRSGQPGK